MALGEPPLDRPVEEKISWAKACFDRERSRLLRDHRLVELLESLRTAVQRSRERMHCAGVVDCCKVCEEKEGGSCCGAGLEKHYSGILLLINLLLGVTFPLDREQPCNCFFLSPTGCLLLARHVLCINYVCDKITSRIKPEALADLREAEGEEILLLFQVNETLRKLVK